MAPRYVSEYDLYGVMVNTKREDGSVVREVALMSRVNQILSEILEILLFV